ncbi:MAG TPA: hypothetical protein VGI69_03100 [Gaiellaceae bacterium]|jgi:hypothetical protein
MGVTDWFRRLFSGGPSTGSGSAEDDAILREEYGEGAVGEPEPGGIVGGVSGFAGLEDAQATEGLEEETEAPQDPAP